jgi:hypothetical protein
MARLIHFDGSEERRVPKGRQWSLKELQDAVGGYIEMMPGIDPVRVVLNEEGRLRDLPPNPVATLIVHTAIANMLGCEVHQLPSEVGHRLTYLPMLVGDVLILEPKERM